MESRQDRTQSIKIVDGETETVATGERCIELNDGITRTATSTAVTAIDVDDDDDPHDDQIRTTSNTKTTVCEKPSISPNQHHHNDTKRKMSMDDMLFILLFVARYIVLTTACCLLMIAVLYTIGSVVTLNADNLFCPGYTEEEVRLYNFENNLPEGDRDSCYFIDRKKLNFNDIKNLNLNIFNAFIDISNLSIQTIIQSLLYLIVCLLLIALIIFHAFYLIYDTIFIILKNCNGKNGTTTPPSQTTQTRHRGNSTARLKNLKPINPRVAKTFIKCFRDARSGGNTSGTEHNNNTNTNRSTKKTNDRMAGLEIDASNYNKSMKSKCGEFVQGFIEEAKHFQIRHIKPYFYVDSFLHLFVLALRELIEIMVQFYGLLLYGGLNIFNTQQNILAQESRVLRGLFVCLFACLHV